MIQKISIVFFLLVKKNNRSLLLSFLSWKKKYSFYIFSFNILLFSLILSSMSDSNTGASDI